MSDAPKLISSLLIDRPWINADRTLSPWAAQVLQRLLGMIGPGSGSGTSITDQLNEIEEFINNIPPTPPAGITVAELPGSPVTYPSGGLNNDQTVTVQEIAGEFGFGKPLEWFQNNNTAGINMGGKFLSHQHASDAGYAGAFIAPGAIITAALAWSAAQNLATGFDYPIFCSGDKYAQESNVLWPTGPGRAILQMAHGFILEAAYNNNNSGGVAQICNAQLLSSTLADRPVLRGPGIIRARTSALQDWWTGAAGADPFNLRNVSAGDYVTSGGPIVTGYAVSSTYPGGPNAAGAGVIPFDTLPAGHTAASLIGKAPQAPQFINQGDTFTNFVAATVGGWSGYLGTLASGKFNNPFWRAWTASATISSLAGFQVIVDQLPGGQPLEWMIGQPFNPPGGGAVSGALIANVNSIPAPTYVILSQYLVGQCVSNVGNVYRCTTPGTSGSVTPPTGTGSSISDGTVVWTYMQAVQTYTGSGVPIAYYVITVDNPSSPTSNSITGTISAGTVLAPPTTIWIFNAPPTFWQGRGISLNAQDGELYDVIVQNRSGAAAFFLSGPRWRGERLQFVACDGQGGQTGLRIDAGAGNTFIDTRGQSGDQALVIDPGGSFNQATGLPKALQNMDATQIKFIGGTVFSCSEEAFATASSVGNASQETTIVTSATATISGPTSTLPFTGSVPAGITVGENAFIPNRVMLSGSTIAAITVVGGGYTLSFNPPPGQTSPFLSERDFDPRRHVAFRLCLPPARPHAGAGKRHPVSRDHSILWRPARGQQQEFG